jgi:phage portal protein BeeE
VRYELNSTSGPLGELTGRREYDVNGVIFDQDRMFHVKGPCAPGALRGLGVLETQLGALTLAADLERQANAISLHGVPTGLLKSSNPDADPGDLAAAKAKWLVNQRDRTIQALGPNIDFEPLSWNPEELQLIEARKFSLTQLELMFGLPVGWLGGDAPRKSYANIESDALNVIKFSALAGMTTRAESVFTRKTLPRGQKAIARRDVVLASDTMSRYKSYQLATGNKAWMVVNEVRKIEKLAPIAGGDELPTEPTTPDPNTIDATVVDDPQAIEASPEGGTE